jgi:hypothetical protein
LPHLRSGAATIRYSSDGSSLDDEEKEKQEQDRAVEVEESARVEAPSNPSMHSPESIALNWFNKEKTD